MEEDLSDWIVGILMSALGLVGLTLASGARDVEMSVFGYALAGFAVIFIAGLVRRHHDREDARRQAVKAGTGDHG